jgi:hypothetical protein
MQPLTSAELLDGDARAFFRRVSNQPGGFAQLSDMLLTAYTESLSIAERMNEGHAVLEHATIDRLHRMHGKIGEVSSATEVAANDILDGLNRGVELVERMLAGECTSPEHGAELLGTLRDELYGVMVHLQFQDITSQQLAYVSSLLIETGERMNGLTQLVARYAVDASPGPIASEPTHDTFDPDATTADPTARQSIADAVFAPRPTA